MNETIKVLYIRVSRKDFVSRYFSYSISCETYSSLFIDCYRVGEKHKVFPNSRINTKNLKTTRCASES